MRKPLPRDLSFDGLFAPKPEHEYFEGGGAHPFRPAATRFEPVNAWWLAEMSLLAYVEDDARVVDALARAGFSRPRVIERASTRAIAAFHGASSVVAFRGTRPGAFEDFLTDANVLLADWRGEGRVHRGFRDALEAVHGELRTNAHTWYTGHSLGGALATLAHAARPGAGLITFGAPRCGDRAFARAFPRRAWRVVNNNDIVPRVPPPPYKHIGLLRYFDRKGRLLADPDAATLLTDRVKGHADRVAGIINRWRQGDPAGVTIDPLVDHSPLYYAILCWNAYVDSRRRA